MPIFCHIKRQMSHVFRLILVMSAAKTLVNDLLLTNFAVYVYKRLQKSTKNKYKKLMFHYLDEQCCNLYRKLCLDTSYFLYIILSIYFN